MYFISLRPPYFAGQCTHLLSLTSSSCCGLSSPSDELLSLCDDISNSCPTQSFPAGNASGIGIASHTLQSDCMNLKLNILYLSDLFCEDFASKPAKLTWEPLSQCSVSLLPSVACFTDHTWTCSVLDASLLSGMAIQKVSPNRGLVVSALASVVKTQGGEESSRATLIQLAGQKNW